MSCPQMVEMIEFYSIKYKTTEIEKLQASGTKIGWAASSYDLLHAGHVLYLQEAKKNCDFLIAGLHINPKIDRPFKNTPIQSTRERLIQLEAVRYVDMVIAYTTEEEHRSILRTIKPALIFKGSDYTGKPIIEDEGLFDFLYIDRSHGWSTSELRSRIVVASTHDI